MTTGKANLKIVGRLDTVGVAGSTPVEPTILKLKANQNIIEIPDDFDVIPSIRWTNGKPRMFRVLVRKQSKRIEKGETFSRPKKA